jgi:YHS domain-containing protein
MRGIRPPHACFAAIGLLCLGLSACDQPSASDSRAVAPRPRPVATTQMCAVMPGHPVDGRLSIEHEGQRIAFCCAECIPLFKKNPGKYLAKAD